MDVVLLTSTLPADPFQGLDLVASPRNNDYLDYFAEWIKTSDGAADFFDVLNHGSQYLEKMSLSEGASQVVKNVGSSASLAWMMLVWPDFFADINSLRHSFTDLYTTFHLPTSEQGRTERIQNVAVHALKKGLSLINTTSDAAGVLYTLKWVSGGPGAPFFNILWNLSSLISDSWDLFVQTGMRAEYELRIQGGHYTQQQNQILQNYSAITFIKIIQDISSVAAAALVLVCIFFASLVEGLVFIPPLLLGLSTVYLGTSIILYFYKRIVEAQRALQARGRLV